MVEIDSDSQSDEDIDENDFNSFMVCFILILIHI